MKIELDIKHPAHLVLLASLLSVADGDDKDEALATAQISKEIGTSLDPTCWRSPMIGNYHSIYCSRTLSPGFLNQLCALARQHCGVQVETTVTKELKEVVWK